jgi:preprotein translocase subunit SecF
MKAILVVMIWVVIGCLVGVVIQSVPFMMAVGVTGAIINTFIMARLVWKMEKEHENKQ